jgi:hypothetical protein
MVEQQQQERSSGLAALAALSLAGWFVLYGLLWYAWTPMYRSTCSPGDDMCGLEFVGPGLLFTGTGALLGFAAWLGATVRAVRGREVLSALSIGLLLPVALVDATLVGHHAVGSVGFAGSWALYSVVSTTLLATSVTRRQTTRRLVAVAGVVLAVALLVASNLVDS